VTTLSRKARIAKADRPADKPISAVAAWTRPVEEIADSLGVVIADLPEAETPAGLRGLLIHTSSRTPARMALAAAQTTDQREQTARRLLWKQITAPVTADQPIYVETNTGDFHAAFERVAAIAAAELEAGPQTLTAEVRVWGNRTVTVAEPSWCNGQHGASHANGDHPEDITHASDETALHLTRTTGEKEHLLTGWLISSPYGADPKPRAAICHPTGDVDDHDEASLTRLAAELRAAADYIEQLRRQLAEATGETW
jgi:hypothetical protein